MRSLGTDSPSVNESPNTRIGSVDAAPKICSVPSQPNELSQRTLGLTRNGILFPMKCFTRSTDSESRSGIQMPNTISRTGVRYFLNKWMHLITATGICRHFRGNEARRAAHYIRVMMAVTAFIWLRIYFGIDNKTMVDSPNKMDTPHPLFRYNAPF